MKIIANVFPEGKRGALTMSYDDGKIYDKRLVEIFNKYGIKGTFHLNSGRKFDETTVCPDEFSEVYKGHEISCHCYSHPFPSVCPDITLINEILDDKRILEEYAGYTVRGMSYPFGEHTEKAINAFRCCGMKYARTTVATNGFAVPADFMKWHPTCHHKGDLKGLFDKFTQRFARHLNHNIMYVWGHSYEFDNDNNWNVIEEFCEYASGREDIWYATNIEIYDYITASRNLEVSVNGTTVYNPSNLSVWVMADGKITEIKPGENKLA